MSHDRPPERHRTSGTADVSCAPGGLSVSRGGSPDLDAPEFGFPQQPVGGASGRSEAESSERETKGSGAERRPLVHSDLRNPPLGQNADTRRLRYRRRSRSGRFLVADVRRSEGLEPYPTSKITADSPEWVRPPRPARCSWGVAQGIGVHGSLNQTAHFSGTERCGSVWACPVCSAVIRHERSEEIEKAATRWQEQGGSLMFLTLTARHTREEGLATTLDAVLKSWSSVIRGAPWKRKAEEIGLRGFIRATEVTWGDANGWHPHLHILLFLDKPISPRRAADFESWVYDRWRIRLVKAGLAEPTKLRGIDLRVVRNDGKMLAQYLAKVQGEGTVTTTTRVHLEMARSDLKSVRGGKVGNLRLAPFEMLDPDCGLSDRRAEALWSEYFKASHGRRAFHWSKGLRELVGLDKDEKTDEEIINDAEQGDLQFVIPSDVWAKLRKLPDQMAAVLEAVELQAIWAAEALSTGDLLVMVDGQFWVEVETGRCFTPSEAAEHFGGDLIVGPAKVEIPQTPVEVERTTVRRRERNYELHVTYERNTYLTKQKRWLAAEREWYISQGQEPPRRPGWKEIVYGITPD